MDERAEKLLRLCGSDNDNEALSALRKLQEHVGSWNAFIDTLKKRAPVNLTRPRKPSGQPPPPPSTSASPDWEKLKRKSMHEFFQDVEMPVDDEYEFSMDPKSGRMTMKKKVKHE